MRLLVCGSIAAGRNLPKGAAVGLLITRHRCGIEFVL